MSPADRAYLDGFAAALAIAHAAADRIATGSMPTLRREMAAEALRAFAEEAGKAVVEAEGWQGPAYQTCREAAVVCSAFPESFRRRNNLTFTHHKEVAALPAAQADALPIWRCPQSEETPVALADAPKSGAVPSNADLRARAASLGYVGEACPDCANFTMVRNGTCLKCDTCGSTTGCS